ncbi:MAG: acyltransferase family protein [Propionibacteriaceae bacterium]|nr:acyltransferase family protein [Propionibacteriaceae bacterium]
MTEPAVRLHGLDAVRGYTILVVVGYHVFYLFNSSGVVSSFPGGYGIHWLDVVPSFVYPWMMLIMFTVAGISARLSLARRTVRQFLRERVLKLIIPLVGALTLLGWIIPVTQAQFTDIFAGYDVTLPVRLVIYWLTGYGVLWFLVELFVCSLVLVVFRQFDRGDRFFTFAGRWPLWALIGLAVPIWGASMILNMPRFVMFRFGIYPLGMLIGYFVLANPAVLERLRKAALWLLGAAAVLGVAYSWVFFGRNWLDDGLLQNPLTNAYAWVAVLALLGGAIRWCDRPTRFATWLQTRSFPIYIAHYNFAVLGCWLLIRFFGMPMPLSYLLLAIFVVITTVIFIEITIHVPVLRLVLYGITVKKTPRSHQTSETATSHK